MEKKTIIKSTSGIRGIIGTGLEPITAAAYGAAFGTFLKKGKVVVGRDSRPSGAMIMPAVISGLLAVGIDVIDIGIVPTPTVEIAVKKIHAQGGICITASHNPSQWNALKFFNHNGVFITPQEYEKLDKIFNLKKFAFKKFDKLGKEVKQTHWVDEHVKSTLAIKEVNKRAIKRRKFKVVVDAINGAGSVALPLLLEKLGVQTIAINCAQDGNFVHEPEPVPKNLTQLSRAVKKHKADLGLACDPDADRLALVDEKGNPIGEELTLTIAVKAVLSKKHGPTVINLSTSKVTEDIARSLGSKVYYSKVGESNVVQTMKTKKAVIGGEGNGGVIYPAFHSGRDSLIGAALVLTVLAEEKKSLAELVATFPRYYNIKLKDKLKSNFAKKRSQFEKNASSILGKSTLDKRDGLRFNFKQGWLQIRLSKTEPIYRLIVETKNKELTKNLADKVKKYFK
ncbi:MAG: phosphoglucosamine mutase [FCB group bacterium]|nr:phosphoglucosamine mutase [FCB group bacterium]